MTTMPKGINWNEQFYKLLRLSLGLTQEFPVEVDADGWRRLYQTAMDGDDCIRQPYASRSSVSAIMACACCQRAASRL